MEMISLHPNILERDGEKVFVVLPYNEFVMIEEELQDYEDLKLLRAAKAEEAGAEVISLSEVRKRLGF
jgi:hypothetical protein